MRARVTSASRWHAALLAFSSHQSANSYTEVGEEFGDEAAHGRPRRVPACASMHVRMYTPGYIRTSCMHAHAYMHGAYSWYARQSERAVAARSKPSIIAVSDGPKSVSQSVSQPVSRSVGQSVSQSCKLTAPSRWPGQTLTALAQSGLLVEQAEKKLLMAGPWHDTPTYPCMQKPMHPCILPSIHSLIHLSIYPFIHPPT